MEKASFGLTEKPDRSSHIDEKRMMHMFFVKSVNLAALFATPVSISVKIINNLSGLLIFVFTGKLCKLSKLNYAIQMSVGICK